MAKRDADATPRARAFLFLAGAISTGKYLPGEIIRIADVARELGLSGTPVREALCRLAGAHLVDDRAREGFRLVQMTSDEIAVAYRLEAFVYGSIVAERGRIGSLPLRDDPGSGGRVFEAGAPSAYDSLQRTTSNATLRALAADLAACLAPYRRHERNVIPAAVAERRMLDDAVAEENWPAASAALSRYAARCAAHAHRLQIAGSRR